MKLRVVEQLGETALLLPELVNQGLSANDRLKYYLTLLQAAVDHAEQPQLAFSNLRIEREASGVEDVALDDTVGGSRRCGEGVLAVPGASRLRGLLLADLNEMLRPIEAAPDDQSLTGAAGAFRRRLDALAERVPSWRDDRVEPEAVAAMTRVAGAGGDTVHQLVMDLHRALNQLQGAIARESIDGARTYGLTDTDRALVRAFMSGLNETAGLKFDHPGLGTTATRANGRLSIQNDIGTTDAHVIVLSVAGLEATLIYTDAHRRRAEFFRDLLAPAAVSWDQAAAPAGAAYEMSIGRFTAPDQPALEQYLCRVGSRLVFLIDWNKARKHLTRFVRKSDAIQILKWAADNNIGHRAFLQAGDIRLIYTALERAARAQLRYGARLDELVGRDTARLFLMAALRITSDGLRSHRSLRLIQDEIEAELLTHLQTTERSTLAMAAEHATIVATLAERLRHVLVRAGAGHGASQAARTAALAKTWETRADELVTRACRLRDQGAGATILTRLLASADDVADALEETAFLLTLIPPDTESTAIASLRPIAELVGRSTREYVRCLECARELPREPARADVEDVLVAVDHLLELEHESDGEERAVKARLLEMSKDFRELYVLSAIARGFEQSADALARCSLIVRDYVLNGVAVAA